MSNVIKPRNFMPAKLNDIVFYLLNKLAWQIFVSAGKELTEDEVHAITESLPPSHKHVVKRRVDTLNATLRKKQKYTTKIDVRNIFPKQGAEQGQTTTDPQVRCLGPRSVIVANYCQTQIHRYAVLGLDQW